MYEKCGMRVKAAEEAVKIKDVETVDRLRNLAGVGTVEGREIERLGAGLKRPWNWGEQSVHKRGVKRDDDKWLVILFVAFNYFGLSEQ
jgi:hypothetical protein